MVAVPSPRVDRKERYWGIAIAITHSSSFYKSEDWDRGSCFWDRGEYFFFLVVNKTANAEVCAVPFVKVL